jgi:hypothetical protein
MNFSSVSRRAMLALAGAGALILAGCGGGGYDAPDEAPPVVLETIGAALNGDQEAPLRVNTGATGSASFTLDRSTRTLSGSVTLDGVVPTAAHIHAGAVGSAGAVAIALSVSPTYAVTLPATVLTADQLALLDAGELYVNIHSAAQPGGEIRGQIGREVYVARLNGEQETTPVATAATGRGVLVLNPATRALSGELELSGMTATAAHVHAGAFGSDGGVLVTLVDHGGHGHYTVPDNTVLTQAQVDALRAGGLYFNAHSAAHASGEVRGQIGRRVLFASADATQEVPRSSSAANGRAFVVYDPQARGVSGSFAVNDMTATAAHIHAGAAGTNGGVVVGLAETAAGVWSVPANTTLTAVQAQALLDGGMYVNAHSAAFTGGEIRGQIGREVYAASLTGAQETAPVATAASGQGFVVLDPETGVIGGEMALSGITATAAHIHAGALGSNGGIVVTLEDHGGHGHYTVPAGTVLTAAQVDSLRAGALYFNAHSAAHAGGELRGQIGRFVLVASADAAQEVPANASTATGRALLTVDPKSRVLAGSFTLSGMTATAAHIHAGVAGTNGAVVVGLTESAPGVWSVASGTVLTAAQLQAMLGSGMYVNAHSAAVTSGEIRGQLGLQ